MIRGIRHKVFDEIWWERDRQDVKWGEQNHDHTVWLTVATEELGEAAEAILNLREAIKDNVFPIAETDALVAELRQTGAVIVAWLEWIERGCPR